MYLLGLIKQYFIQVQGTVLWLKNLPSKTVNLPSNKLQEGNGLTLRNCSPVAN